MTDHAFDFHTWMCEQHGNYQLKENDERHYHILSGKIDGEINFYPVDEGPDIVEFRIEQNEETKFFLHFQPIDEVHAKGLYEEFIHKIYSMENEKQLKILLCCSVGMTTSFFAEKLNETARQLDEDIGFNAVSVNQVYSVGEEYDAVLVAPQVGYMTKRLQEALPDVPVVQISAQIFGAYDSMACIKMVLEVIDNKKKSNEDRALEHVAHNIQNDKKILIITVLPNVKEAWVRYRIFDHGRIILDREVIKETFYLDDMIDIIHTTIITQKCSSPVQAVGIAIPGMIHDGKLEFYDKNNIARKSIFDLVEGHDADFNLESYLTELFHIPVLLHNNANAAAVGWYGSQNEYNSIVFQSQAAGYIAGGQGIIADGHLIPGAHDSAGELRYIIRHLDLVKDVSQPVKTPEEMVHVVTAGIFTACVIVDPQVVCVRSPMTPDMNEIQDELKKYMPESHLPKLVYINNMDEYAMLGEMILVLMKLQNQ